MANGPSAVPKFEDNIRDEVQLDKEFEASLREHGVIVPIIAVRDAEGRTLVREGQRRTFPGKLPCNRRRCWLRAEVGAVTTWPGLGLSPCVNRYLK